MVVIQLQRPQTNFQAITSAGSAIFQKIAENNEKLKIAQQLQQQFEQEKGLGREVTKTFGKEGQFSGFTSKIEAPSKPGVFNIGGHATKTPLTGTNAITVPSDQPQINPAQVLGGASAQVAPSTIQPSQALSPLQSGVNLGGTQRLEEFTTDVGPEKLKFKRVKPASEKQEEAEAKAQASLRSAQLKDVEKRKVNLRSSKLKLGNSLRSFVDVGRRTEKLVPGVKPGVIGGSISAVLGATKKNEFVRGFVGGLTEVAAAVGATAIPNARAVRLVSLFKGTGIGRFDTVESGIQTTADSIVNGISGDMAAAPWEYIFGDLPNERQSKAKWDSLTREQQTQIVDKELPILLEKFEDDFVREALGTIFDEDSQLLGDETVQRIGSERQVQRNTFTSSQGDVFVIN